MWYQALIGQGAYAFSQWYDCDIPLKESLAATHRAQEMTGSCSTHQNRKRINISLLKQPLWFFLGGKPFITVSLQSKMVRIKVFFFFFSCSCCISIIEARAQLDLISTRRLSWQRGTRYDKPQITCWHFCFTSQTSVAWPGKRCVPLPGRGTARREQTTWLSVIPSIYTTLGTVSPVLKLVRCSLIISSYVFLTLGTFEIVL